MQIAPAHPSLAASIILATALGATQLSTASPDEPPAPTTAPTSAASPSATLGGLRLALLREGSTVSRVVGDLAQDPDDKLWLFRPIVPEAGGLRREFVLLPSPVLEDMLQTNRVSGAPVQFEVTGRVFIYRGRNFLLADFAPTIVRFDAKPSEEQADAAAKPPAEATLAPNGEDKFVPPDSKERSAVDAIEKRLEERVGRAPQVKVNEGIAIRDGGSQAKAKAPIANGSRITQRLGKLTRDPQAGTWRFAPAQNSGSGDPTVELLPCLLLEKLELQAREGDSAPSILISGMIYAYEGRSYLLPTSFRRAVGGRGIGG